ncbi:MAG: SPOR domain-containing protein [Bacteroidetes bacterium]|nr:SPOR domain-containing protein [Bacteroidota bacterium]
MNRVIAFFIVCLVMTFVFRPGAALAQRFSSEDESQKTQGTVITGDQNAQQAYLSLKAGELNDARRYLTEADPSDPFAIFVRAALTPDAVEAADTYKEIIAEYPGKPIAQEALLQLYKYHFAAGDYGDAHTDYLELRKYSPMMTQLVDPLGFEDTLHLPPTVPAPPVSNEPPKAVGPVRPSILFAVQFGAFSTPQNARSFAATLKDRGISATVFTKVDGNRTLYAVGAGGFSTRAAAEAYAQDLKRRSIDCIVVQK